MPPQPQPQLMRELPDKEKFIKNPLNKKHSTYSMVENSTRSPNNNRINNHTGNITRSVPSTNFQQNRVNNGYSFPNYQNTNNGFYGLSGGGFHTAMMPGMYNPMAFIYSVNFFISAVSQIVHLVGMNAHVVIEMIQGASKCVLTLEKVVRQSELRRWIQRKSKKSAVLRYMIVLLSMALTNQLYTIARYLLEQYLGSRLPIASNSGKVVGSQHAAAVIGES